MPGKAPLQKKIRFAGIVVIALAAMNGLLWYGVLMRKAAPARTAVAGPPAGVFRRAPVPVPQESVGVPVRIMIPSIGVDAEIEQVTLTVNGAMGVPKRPLDAGWYAAGPRPGEVGNAAISGHVDWTHGSAAVFAALHKVEPGDRIAVLDDKGAAVMFTVRESRSYDAAADAREVFVATDGKAHLNVITCEGTWDKLTRQYSKRLVVFADKETE